MPPEITAVITTHARPASALEALRSVQADLHEDLEIIVVDDGDSFVAPDVMRLPVRVVRGVGLGVARARNLGLAVARGEFILYLDDDDVALPNRVSSLLRAARQHHATLCFGMTQRLVGDVGGVGSVTAVLPDVPTNLPSGLIGFHDVLTCTPHVNAVLVRTDALRAVGGFDVRADHFDDWAAWLRIADCEDAVLWSIDEPVAEWRIHSHGLSGKLLAAGALKRHILGMFEHLHSCLSDRNARAVLDAHRLVTAGEILTYDDYVRVMVEERAATQSARTARFSVSAASSARP